MTTKRWTAIGVAIGLFVLSFIISDLALKSQQVEKFESGLTETASTLFGQQGLSETIVSKGSQTERIALLTINGTIMANQTSNLLDTSSYNHDFFMNQLDAIKADNSVKGILLSVNSPGGGTYESAQIKDKIDEIKKETKMPIYVSMENVAASGGYYIAASADKIFASKETLTGSIGVIMSNLNLSELYDKIGIEDDTVKSGQFKDIGSSSKKMTTADQTILQKLVDDSYDRFVSVVAKGRGMDEKRVRSIADGRIYDGEQAKSIGLIDQIGYQEEALKSLKQDYNFENAEVFQYSTGSLSFMSLINSKANQLPFMKNNSEEIVGELAKQFGMTQSPRMMYLYGGE